MIHMQSVSSIGGKAKYQQVAWLLHSESVRLLHVGLSRYNESDQL